MIASFFLAVEEVQQATEQAARPGWMSMPTTWPHQADLLTWCQDMTPGVAALLILAGIVYLLFGFQIFKALVLMNAAIVGAYIGALIGAKGEAAVAGAAIGAFAAAAITWPAMKYAVALMGGIFGMILGATIWRTANLDPNLVWAGALTGLIGFGLLSFVLFKGSVMMYTSMQGAFMLVFGILGLIFKYHDVAPKVSDHLKLQPFVLPAVIFIPAVIGLIFQHHNDTGGGAPHGGKK